MTRIISGRWGGRRLATLEGSTTRPSTGRAREAMFASLGSELGGWRGVRVLDLFAGSGALGLEALSRGAEAADLVESHRRAAAVLARNIRELGATHAQLHRMPVERFIRQEPAQPYDLVFLDPPYAMSSDELLAIVETLAVGVWRSDDSVVVVERPNRAEWNWPESMSSLRDRTYGETRLWYGR